MPNVLLPNGQTVSVFVKHEQKPEIRPCGRVVRGRTTVGVFTADKVELGTGVAFCHEQEQFNKHEGLKHALQRALAIAGLDKPSRTKIWSRVYNHRYDRVAVEAQK